MWYYKSFSITSLCIYRYVLAIAIASGWNYLLHYFGFELK